MSNHYAPFGATCSSLPPVWQAQCAQTRLNALIAGRCDQLSGCDAAVCRDLFPNGVYPRLMPYSGHQPVKPTKVYAYGSYPQIAPATFQRICHK